MPFVSERRPATVAGALGLALFLAGLGAGCTSPQSGAFAANWCHPSAADGKTYVMLDDMEDGDSVPCAGGGSWTVDGTANFVPAAETTTDEPVAAATVGGPATPVALPSADQGPLDTLLAAATLSPSFRAQHLHGAIGPGGFGGLILPLATPDLTTYQELDFWAKSDAGAAIVRVGAFTTAGTYFYEDVTIQPSWGDSSAPLLGALVQLDGTPVTAADLTTMAKLEFQFLADSNGDPASFGFWVDDVVLKRSPTP